MAPIAIPNARALSLFVACIIRPYLSFASRAKSWSLSERSVHIMSILKTFFGFLALEHSQRDNKRIPVIKLAYTLLPVGAGVLSLLMI
jgi:hypothetical protein